MELIRMIIQDVCHALEKSFVDLIVTSPPYWRKRDYGIICQIGQERTSEDYVASIISAMGEWRRVLRPSGSVFLNIGDTYWQKKFAGDPWFSRS